MTNIEDQFNEFLDKAKECGMVGIFKMPDGSKRYFSTELTKEGFMGGVGDHLDYDMEYADLIIKDLIQRMRIIQEGLG